MPPQPPPSRSTAAGSPSSTKKSRPLPELIELAQQIGEFMMNWGFKRVHGRVWTHLMLEKSPLSAKDLTHRLQISKALVSMTLAELLKYDVILEVGKGARGSALYHANPDIMHAIQQVVRSREKRILARIDAAYRSLKAVPEAESTAGGISPARLRFVGEWVEAGSQALELFQNGFRFDLSASQNFTLPEGTENGT